MHPPGLQLCLDCVVGLSKCYTTDLGAVGMDWWAGILQPMDIAGLHWLRSDVVRVVANLGLVRSLYPMTRVLRLHPLSHMCDT